MENSFLTESQLYNVVKKNLIFPLFLEISLEINLHIYQHPQSTPPGSLYSGETILGNWVLRSEILGSGYASKKSINLKVHDIPKRDERRWLGCTETM